MAAQPLAGVLQTAYRAELTATLAALDYGLDRGVCVRVWTDCLNVVKAYDKYVVKGLPVNPNRRNADLLREFVRKASDLGPDRLAVLKVPAHEDRNAYQNDLERWLVDGNCAADRAAASANANRSPDVWKLWTGFGEQLTQARFQGTCIRHHMVQVARHWHETFGPKPVAPVVFFSVPKPARAQPVLLWEDPHDLVLQHPTFVKSFGHGLAAAVHSWISRIRDLQSPLRWVSYLQLYISFQRCQGPWAITKRAGRWEADQSSLAALANHVNLNIRVKHFRLMLQQYLRDAEVRFSSGTVRPFSNWLACFRGSIGFHLSQSEYDIVEGKLSSVLEKPATGDGSVLRNLRGV